MKFADKVCEALISVLPHNGFTPLHEPLFEGKEWDYVKQCLDSGWVSSAGKFVDSFEAMLAEYCGTKYAVATSNGTAALHIALLLAGVMRGEEVLMPALTFVATANAASYLGAIPHFVDSEEKTLGMAPQKLALYLNKIAELRCNGCYNTKTGNRIAAVVPMHTFGHPVDMEPLMEICERFQIPVIEDAAESLGSTYKGKHCGGFGRIGILSFNGNKIVTTGGGGAILTNDKELGEAAKHVTTTAKIPHKWEYFHDQVGFNYRLPNINAALGCAQLERLPLFIERKRSLAKRYDLAFKALPGIRFYTEPEFARSNYWLNVLLLDDCYSNERDKILEVTNAQGIVTRPTWTLMHKLPMYEKCPRMDLSCAESIEKRLINIPSSPNLSE